MTTRLLVAVFAWAGARLVAETTVWPLRDVDRVGGYAAEVCGKPRAVRDAVAFDGKGDGLLVPANPLAGCDAWTVEILFRPDEGGGTEQRFFHVEEQEARGRRGLIELRVDGEGHWWLDTHLRTESERHTLIDPKRQHPTGKWVWVALRYDGKTMSHFVDGEKELEAPMMFPPMSAGKFSLGMRQDRRSWFKGEIREVRFSTEALAEEKLQRVK